MIVELYRFGALIKGRIADNEEHSHLCLQISQTTSAQKIFINGAFHQIPADTSFVINSGVPHSLPDSDWKILLLDPEAYVSNDILSTLSGRDYCLLNGIVPDELVASLNQMKTSMRSEIEIALNLMREHDHNCDIDEIARAVHLSPDRMRHVFSEETGIPFRNYLLWQKIRKLFRLHSSDEGMNLADLAVMSGFPDQAHMSRVLKQNFGFSPKILTRSLKIQEK